MVFMEEILQREMIQIVQSFCTKWNAFESDICKQHEAEEERLEKENPDTYHYAPRTNWFEKFAAFVVPLIEDYCTDKKRVYGGKNIYSFGYPSKYAGVEDPVAISAEIKNKNRAEVYIKTNTHFTDEYLFVLLRKANAWKIDSYKNRRYGGSKWNNAIL